MSCPPRATNKASRTPDFLYTPEMFSYVGEKVEGLFADFNLQLRPILFCDPEIPFDLFQRYR